MRLSAAVVSLAALTFAAIGCEELEKAQNENVLVFTLLQSPEFQLPDGKTERGITAATAFYGKRVNPNPGQPLPLDAKPEGVPGATVTLKWGSKSVRLSDKGAGSYLADTVSEGTGLTALEQAEYTIEVVNDEGQVFTGTVTPPPPVVIAEFEGTDAFCNLAPDGISEEVKFQHCRQHTKNTDFTISRKDKTTGELLTDATKNDLGFWAVYKVSNKIDPKNPNATNFPKEPVEVVQLIAADAPYRAGTFTVPGSAFDDAGSDKFYGVGLMVAKKGTTSNNLFVGSAVLAGHASGGVLWVKQ